MDDYIKYETLVMKKLYYERDQIIKNTKNTIPDKHTNVNVQDNFIHENPSIKIPDTFKKDQQMRIIISNEKHFNKIIMLNITY
jgi:hypothetical protein